MTALPPNADELVSAYLDGEATPDELAMVEASEELMARVTELAAVSARLAAPLTPPPATRELHLAAALAAFDEVMAAPAAEPTAPARTATVHAIELGRERRQARRSPGRWVAAAAAAAALVVGVTAVSVNRSDDATEQVADSAETSDDAAADTAAEADDATDDSAAESQPAAAAEARSSEDEAVEGDAAAAMTMADEATEAEAVEEVEAEEATSDTDTADFAAAGAAPAPLLAPPLEYFLGEFDSLQALNEVLSATPIDEIFQRTAQITEQGLFPDCQQSLDELRGEVSTVIAEATVVSMPVEVHLVPDLEPATVIIVDKGSCEVLATVPLTP